MFGFSLTKLLFTAFAIAVVWYGFKWMGRVQEQRIQRARAKPSQSPGAASPPPGAEEAEEMIKCPVCEAYVTARGAVSCGREGCPYPG